MIKYTLFKTAVNCDYCETTQNIIRYAYKELKKDIRPTNIIERDYPEELENKLPSVYLWNEKNYILGGENVVAWMEETLKFPNIQDIANEWSSENSEYRIHDDHTKKDYDEYGESSEYTNEDETALNKIITFAAINLWSDKYNRDVRFNNFCEIIKNIEPDIICIQDINETFLQKLIQQDWCKMYFKSAYHISKNINTTGEVIISKFPIIHKETFPFNNTTTGQTVHIAHIQIPLNYFQQPIGSENEFESMNFPVITAQLEKNKGFSDIRKEQLYSMFNMVLPLSTVFILVDSNLTDEDTDFINLPEGWKDGYEENFSNLEIGENQHEMREYVEQNTFTYDSESNMYISGYQRYRYDRIFYKSKDANCGWRCIDFELICNDVPVSTHFGIFATFEHT
jgi:hypothetical protein